MKLKCDEFGNIPDENDLSADFGGAWNSEGLFFYFLINDDTEYTDSVNPWNGDAVEIFLSPYKGSEDIIQVSIPLVFDREKMAFPVISDRRKSHDLLKKKPDIIARGNRLHEKIELEIFVDTKCLGKTTASGEEFSLQIYVDDSDQRNDSVKNRLTLYNGNFAWETSFNHCKLVLAEKSTGFSDLCNRISIIDDRKALLTIAGTEANGSLEVYKSKEVIFSRELKSGGNDTSFMFEIPVSDLDLEQDSLYVCMDGQCIGFYNLIITPRIYESIDPPRFIQAIRKFKLEDRVNPPPKEPVLFIGSSSIRMWDSLKVDFPELTILHRGFGGSNSADVLFYMEDIVLPYKAEKIIYYEGDNDIVSGFTIDTIISNMKQFISRVQKERPGTSIFLLSPKPSIARMRFWKSYEILHRRMKELVNSYDEVYFIDVATPMFDENGKLRKEIFIEDNIHMNRMGYIIWKNVLRKGLGLE